jgi:hypothetical protein
MQILAIILLVLVIYGGGSTFYNVGSRQERKPYGIEEILSWIISTAILIPLIGRTLGWW